MARKATAAVAPMWLPDPAGVYFSDRFRVDPALLESYGALDVSVVSDLPLFIDPFLLFNSEDPTYQVLHNQIIEYLRFLKGKADDALDPKLIEAWYAFKEVKQNWLGFTVDGNGGHGLGKDFARALNGALTNILGNLGSESLTRSTHLEKLALIRPGVGRDTISDFTTNLIKHFLLDYTEKFTLAHVPVDRRSEFTVAKAAFNYNTETWSARKYTLPNLNGDYVLLTPLDLLTTNDTWINRTDMIRRYEALPVAVEDGVQRSLINNYFENQLADNPTPKERDAARAATIARFPELVDHYIKIKEDTGEEAAATSLERTNDTRAVLVDRVKAVAEDLAAKTDFFTTPWTSYDEAKDAVAIFKRYVEDQDGYRLINRGDGKGGFASEAEVQAFFGLLLQASRFDVNREPNNGRGPVDFKLSHGALDKSLIEFKLAKSTSLKRNLGKQVEIYEVANGTRNSLKVIIFYTEAEQAKAEKVLKELGLTAEPAVVLIDARSDNKPSASKA